MQMATFNVTVDEAYAHELVRHSCYEHTTTATVDKQRWETPSMTWLKNSCNGHLVRALVCVLGVSMMGNLNALEGGSTSTSEPWKNVTPYSKPDASTRTKEKAARQADIQAEVARLQARLKTAPSPEKMAELHGKLQTIVDNFGWEPQQEMVYGIRSAQPMLRGQNTMPKNLLSALKQLNEDFKARDIDFIFVPLVPTPQFAAHTLVDGIEADQDYYPGWTEDDDKLLEHDIEVVDTVEIRASAEDDVLVSWANDFHTGSRGRQIAAEALAKRLQRYDFARELQKNANKAEVKEASKTGTMMPQRIPGSESRNHQIR